MLRWVKEATEMAQTNHDDSLMIDQCGRKIKNKERKQISGCLGGRGRVIAGK